MSAPDLAIVVGAMKAGTTTLFRRLADHPGVVGSEPKEPVFFADDEAWQRGPDWYRDRWPQDLDGRTRLEASTGYTMWPRYPRTWQRMRSHVDERDLDVRFVYSLRDPIERVRSHLTHWWAGNQDHKLTTARWGTVEGHTLCTSMYAAQLDAYLEHFPREHLHVVRFEELVEDTEATLASVLDFLGIDPDGLDRSEEVHNPTTGKYRKSALWRAAETVGLPRLADALPEPLLDRLRGLLGDRVDTKLTFSEGQDEAYLHALEADLRRLRDVHDVPLDGWTLPPGLRGSTDETERRVGGEPA